MKWRKLVITSTQLGEFSKGQVPKFYLFHEFIIQD